jgi:hypothetical protein
MPAIATVAAGSDAHRLEPGDLRGVIRQFSPFVAPAARESVAATDLEIPAIAKCQSGA